MGNKKYSDEAVTQAVAESRSVLEVLRRLDIKPAGGSNVHIRRRIKELGLDTSHFLGRAASKGTYRPKLESADILKRYPPGSFRAKAHLLRRALVEIGRDVRCEGCGITDTYNGKPIVLHIDHIDGDCLNSVAENLRFMCPNCHSQTETFGHRGVVAK